MSQPEQAGRSYLDSNAEETLIQWPESSSIRRFNVNSRAALMGALILLTFAAYANSISAGLIYDDIPVIANNPLFGHWDRATITQILTRDLWAPIKAEPAGAAESDYYRPAFGMFLMAAYEVAGRKPERWHLISILLHIAVVMMVFLVIEESLKQSTELSEQKRRLTAGLAAAIYAVHPVQSEAVVWISASTNPLLLLFLLAGFYAYLKSRVSSGVSRLSLTVAALAGYGLAVLTKESVVALALIPPAYEAFVLNRGATLGVKLRRASAQGVMFIGVAAGYLVLRYSVLGVWLGSNVNANYPDEYSLNLLDTLRTAPSLLVFYVRLAVFPFNLSMIYGLSHVRAIGFEVFWAPLFIACLVIGLAIWCFKRAPDTRAALIWIAVPIASHLNTRMFVSDDLVHDRYLYGPMVGVSLLIAFWLVKAAESAGRRFASRWVEGAILASLPLVLAMLTLGQNARWHGEEAIWTDTAEHAPNSRMVHIALGLLAEKREDLENALAHYDRALQVHPDIVDALNNQAFVYAHQGRWAQATSNFERIATLTPSNPMSHFNLSVAYAAQRRYREEREELQKAVDLDPGGGRTEEWRSRLDKLARIASQN